MSASFQQVAVRVALLVWVGLVPVGSAAAATDLEAARALLRGSMARVSNVVGVRSFDRGIGQTYDPYVAMALQLRPIFWVHDRVALFADLALSHELTYSNVDTRAGEVVFDDLALGINAPRALTIPLANIHLGASFALAVPTSAASRFRTRILALTPGLSVSRTFDVWGGITLAYGFRVSKFFHRATTSENHGARVPGCAQSTSLATSSCLSTGVRNATVRFVNALDLSVSFVPEFGIKLSAALVHDLLYAQSDAVKAGALGGSDGPGMRHYVMTRAEIFARPIEALVLAVGIHTHTEQLHSDPAITYRNPIYDPHRTVVFFDVRLDVAGALAMAIAAR